uniref:MutS-related protein n=1 Tax=uncultured Draconibacterium sp. TaxID=1573823 RepID=UPI003217A678
MTNQPRFYRAKLEKYTAELNSVSLKVKRFAWYRFFAFAGIFVPMFVFGFQLISMAVSAFLVILFFFLIKKNIQLENQKKRCSILKKLAEDEILALKHSFLHFHNGEEFLNTEHFFSYDLDLFGDGSLFQYLNRTVTVGGRQKLAGWLTKPSLEKNEIDLKQEAVHELSQIPDWRLQFLANGKLFEETEALSHEIKSWSEMELELNRTGFVKWLIKIVPFITLLAAVPSVMGITDFFLLLMVSVQFLLMYFFWKRINQYFSFFGRKSQLLSKYMELLNFVEDRGFKSGYLANLKEKVTEPSAGKIISELKKIVNEFEYRQNILVGILLNGFLVWDIRCVYKLWNWHHKHHKKLAVWLDVIAEIDALISLGNYANNHSGFTFPKIHDGEFIFGANDLGHPLLHEDKRVCNDMEINGWSKVMVVTGANMAGKSTFLRTVGVNLVLARLGAPVCAKQMRITPIVIYTNMRTTDSLLKDESYFFAELKRIKGVLDRLQSGERIFVILDEMLKGTNSVDKLNGSKELIKKLVEFKSVALIATHDLKLSEMENEFPQQVFNKCFEIRIENDELVFDYKLSEGATKTMNATFLMKKMGII